MQKTNTIATASTNQTDDFLPLNGIDHIEFYVGNAFQAAHFYRCVMGFDIVAHRGLETGDKERASYVIEQGKVRFVLTSAMVPDHPIARHCQLHGDGVRDIAFSVKDVDAAFEAVRERGATIVTRPTTVEDDGGAFRYASIKTYGDTIHTFIDRSAYKGG